MKIKAWMVYLLGFPVVYGIGLVITDHFGSLSLVGTYAFDGTIVLGIYYLTRKLFFRKKSNPKKINNNHYT